MRRELSFTKVGKVALVLSVLFYAGFINPVAQAWCEAECPHDLTHSDGPNDLCCHAPDFADTHSMSHFNVDWTPSAVPSAMVITDDRFEISALQFQIEEPDISLDSPPPKSILA